MIGTDERSGQVFASTPPEVMIGPWGAQKAQTRDTFEEVETLGSRMEDQQIDRIGFSSHSVS